MGQAEMYQKDPTVWDEPLKFKPERFLDQNGKFKHPKENFLPFGIGTVTSFHLIIS